MECLGIAAVFTLAAIVGGCYAREFGGYARFEQANYAPAVMVALGHGYVNPDLESVPGLRAFLNKETPELSITPSDLPVDLKTRPLGQAHVRWRYCLYIVGWIWRYSGAISWNALTPLYAVLYGLVAVFSYLVFRLLLAWPFAAVGTLFLIFSPTNLYFLPHLRDYSKAAPIIAAAFTAGYLVKSGTSRTRVFLASLFLGCFLGLMMGFRKDVFICIWPTIAVLFLFLPGGLRRRFWEKTAAAALMLGAFYGVSWPLWAAMKEQGSTSGHVIVYGLLPPFDDFLGIGGVDYELAPRSNDPFTCDVAGAYAERTFSDLGEKNLKYETPEYDKACNAFLMEYAATFPADIILRAYAAVFQKVRYGIFVASHESRYGPVRVPLIERLFAFRFNWLHGMARLQGLLLVFCFLVLSGKAIRYGLALLFLVFYYCGYTCLQFDLRHHFHLEFLWWLLPLFFCQSIVWAVAHAAETRGTSMGTARLASLRAVFRGPVFRRIAISCGLALLALAAPIVLARIYQHYSYAALFSRYAASAKQRLKTEAVPSADPRLVAFRLADSSGETQPANSKPSWCMDQRLLMAEFKGGQDVPFLAHFKDPTKNGSPSSFHRCVVPRLDSEGTEQHLRYFLPVYESKKWARYIHSELAYFEMWKEQEDLLDGVYEVTEADSIPLWFMMTMTDNWATRPRHKMLHDDIRPLYFRAVEAKSHNLIPNGGFETWADGAPAGFSGSGRAFSVQREERYVAEGIGAVRQEWAAKQAGETGFGCCVGPLEPSTLYEVIVSARNPSQDNIVLSAWDMPTTESGEIDSSRPPSRLRYPVLRVVPCTEYSEYWGTFTTGPSPKPMVLLAVQCLGPSFPATVFWDEWRVHKWPGPREAWDFNVWVNVRAQ